MGHSSPLPASCVEDVMPLMCACLLAPARRVSDILFIENVFLFFNLNRIMYVLKIQDLTAEIRTRIANIPEEKYRIALMYAFMTGTDVAQVSGKYRPSGIDAKKITVYNHSSSIDLIMFKIKPNRGKGNIIFSLFPADDSFDPWIKIIYSYFKKFIDEPPFKFHDKFEHSIRYLQFKVEEIFNGLNVAFLFHSKSEMEKKDVDEKRMNSNALRRLRLNDLMINYDFNALDLVLFNNRNDKEGVLSHHIKDIRAVNLLDYSDEELAHRAIPYLTKFLKKNEDDIKLEILSATQGYFFVYSYDKFTSENNTPKEELIEDLSHILNKDKSFVKNVLEQISEFNFTDTKHDRQSQSQLEKMYQWYWNNKENSRGKFDEMYNSLDSDASINYDYGVNDIKIENPFFIEEGSIKYSNIKMRKRSPLLLKKAREYFRSVDNEGKLRCPICGYVKPDYIDREIVHIHHIEHLKDISEEGITTPIEEAIKKTIPLCPTCHSIVHSKENLGLTISQIIKNTYH